MIAIVPFSPEHAEGVFSLILSIQTEEFGLSISRADQPDLASIPSTYQRGAGNFWVALEDGRVVGTIALLDIGDGEGALRKMFVAPSRRGTGLAARLLETLLAWSRARQVRRIVLGTTDRFLAAHRFYEKHGFHELSRSELPSSFPVMAVDSKFYAIVP